MGLKVWLPLNKDLRNLGVADVAVTNNGATVNNNGKLGKCYLSNGNNRFTIPTFPWMTFRPENSFSVALWEKGTATSSVTYIFACTAFELRKTTSYISVGWGSLANEPAIYYATINDSTWYHITFTWDGPTKMLKLYINGVLQGTSNVTGSVPTTISGTLNCAYNGVRYLNDIRIYDHCLSQKEVSEIAKGLVLHYKLDDTYIEPTVNLLQNVNLTASSLTVDIPSYTNPAPNAITVVTGNLQSSYTYSSFRINLPLSRLVDNTQYYLSFKYKITSGTGDYSYGDWRDASFVSTDKTYLGNGVYYVKLKCPVVTYNNIYCFFDVLMTAPNTTIEFTEFQLETPLWTSKTWTPYTSSFRAPEGTTNLLQYSNLHGHGSSWTLQSETFNGYAIYKNVVTSPNTGNNAGFAINSPITPASLSSSYYITISFWKRLNAVYGRNLGGYVRFTKSDSTTETKYWSFNKSNWSNDSSSIGRWDYIYSTVSIPANSTGIQYVYVYIDNATGGDCDFSEIQLELKSRPTYYVDGSRSYESILIDTSGYSNNGELSGGIHVSSGESARYNNFTNFSDSECSIIVGNITTIIPTGIYTMNVWFKKLTNQWSSKEWETIWGNQQGMELETKRSSTNSPVLVAYSWGQSQSGGQVYELDKWNMLTMVRTSSYTKFYLNGVLWYTGSAGSYNSNNYFIGSWRDAVSQNYRGYISDFRLYSSELSASDILDLYHTSAFIDNHSNLECYELVEDTTVPEIKKTGVVSTLTFIERVADYLYLPAGAYVNVGLTIPDSAACKAETIMRYASGGSGRDLMGFSANGGGSFGVNANGNWEILFVTYTDPDITKLNKIIYDFRGARSVRGNWQIGAVGGSYSTRNKYIYHVKIWKAGVLERDLYPASVNGQVGLIDILHCTFYPAQGTSGATLGDDASNDKAKFFADHIESREFIEI